MSKGILGVLTESKSKAVSFPGVPVADSLKVTDVVEIVLFLGDGVLPLGFGEILTFKGVFLVLLGAAPLGVTAFAGVFLALLGVTVFAGVFLALLGVAAFAGVALVVLGVAALAGVFLAGDFLALLGVVAFAGVFLALLGVAALAGVFLVLLGVAALTGVFLTLFGVATFLALFGVAALTGDFLALFGMATFAGVFLAGVAFLALLGVAAFAGVFLALLGVTAFTGLFFTFLGVASLAGDFLALFGVSAFAFFKAFAGVFIISANPWKLVSLPDFLVAGATLKGVFRPFLVLIKTGVLFFFLEMAIAGDSKACPDPEEKSKLLGTVILKVGKALPDSLRFCLVK
jgi:hypothetical protein